MKLKTLREGADSDNPHIFPEFIIDYSVKSAQHEAIHVIRNSAQIIFWRKKKWKRKNGAHRK